MNNHLHSIGTALNHGYSHILGIAASAGVVVGANADLESTVEVMDYVLFTLGLVDFKVSSLLTFSGAATGIAIALVSWLKFLSNKE